MRECADTHLTNLEADLARLRRENKRLTEACAQDVVVFSKLGAAQTSLEGRTSRQASLLEEAEQQITHLREQLIEKEADIRRLEEEAVERTQLVESRAVELSELQVRCRVSA